MAIYDCFPFFNELDLLQVRLRELDGVVDRFVLVEAPVTHAGRPKPLFFAEHAADFARWRGRIEHVVVNDMPTGPDPWSRENHQRNAIRRGLHAAAPGDGVIISDCDEIPAAEAVRRWDPATGPRAFAQLFSYYWMNCVGGGWAGSRIMTAADFARYPDATAVRLSEFPLLERGGWHVSYAGGPERIVAKLEAYAHQDLNSAQFKDPANLMHAVTTGADLFGREGHEWSFVPLDERFPAAVREDRSRFRQLVCEAVFHENWYPNVQVRRLLAAARRARPAGGAVMEIGCWEGKSTVALANEWHPEMVLAVDTWAGSADESPEHPSVLFARQRDVFAQFLTNVRALTRGNVTPIRRDCHEVLAESEAPLKFVHIDASHDYRSVRRTIEACLRRLVPGGILCGANIQTADMNRADLGGGVERAVREALPGFEQEHDSWLWQRPREV